MADQIHFDFTQHTQNQHLQPQQQFQPQDPHLQAQASLAGDASALPSQGIHQEIVPQPTAIPQQGAVTDHAPAPDAAAATATADGWAAADAVEARARMEMLEKEAAKLRELHAQMNADNLAPAIPTDDEKREGDARSIYIGNVDYGATPLELQQHFSEAGAVTRVTIMMNKLTGQPKGFAYLEFADEDSVNKAVATLDGSLFRERELKVCAKRTNIPGLSAIGRGGFRGRGGRGGPRGGFRGRGGRGGRGRGAPRGAPRFTPY